jgi:hypothetical protein
VIEHLPEDRLVGDGEGEQRHRRLQLLRVNGAEHLDGVGGVEVGEDTGALDEPPSEGGMPCVGAGLLEAGDREALRHPAVAEPAELGEDEPHPVGALLAVPELGESLVVGLGLGVDEALQIEGHVGHRAVRRSAPRRRPGRQNDDVRLLRGITLAVLVVLVGGGWFGGLSFLTDPSGAGLGMSAAELPDWPLLEDFTLPGIALIVLFGLFPLVPIVLLLRHDQRGWPATAAVGALLVLWMLGQVVAIGLTFPGMQLTFLVVGLLLTALGSAGLRLDAGARTS